MDNQHSVVYIYGFNKFINCRCMNYIFNMGEKTVSATVHARVILLKMQDHLQIYTEIRK